jgi:hypothetical protein
MLLQDCKVHLSLQTRGSDDVTMFSPGRRPRTHSKGVMVVSPTIKRWEIPSLEIVTGKTDTIKTLAPAVRGPTISVDNEESKDYVVSAYAQLRSKSATGVFGFGVRSRSAYLTQVERDYAKVFRRQRASEQYTSIKPHKLAFLCFHNTIVHCTK